MKLLFSMCLLAFAAAQHFRIDCVQDSDCPKCNSDTNVHVCINFKCECIRIDNIGKRQHCNQHQCDASCPTDLTGECSPQGHCKCVDHVRNRASNRCMTDAECSANSCKGDHVPSCDIQHNYCFCKNPHT